MTVTFRLLVPILIGIALAIGALTFISVNSQQTLIAQREDSQLAQAFDGFFAQANDQERLAQSLATGVSNLPEAGSAFYWQDAQGLLAQVTPFFHELDNAYGISELNFYIAPATVFLRVTDPLNRNDDVSGYRQIAVRTISKGLPQSGLEVGKRGIGLFSAVPVIHTGNFIGIVEVGKDLNSTFLDQYKARWHVDAAVYVKRSVLERASATAPASSAPAPVGGLDLIARTAESVQAPAASFDDALAGKKTLDRVTQNANSFAVQVGPLTDYSGETIGAVQLTLPRAAVLDAIDTSRNVSLLWGGAIFLLVIFGVYAMTNSMVIRPLAHLTIVTDQFRAGKRTSRAHLQTQDELGRLGTTFNTMADEIGGLVTGLEERVAERTASLERNTSYLIALQNTMLDLGSRLDVNELLQAIVTRAGSLVGTENGYVFLLNQETGEMTMRVGIGVYTHLIGTQARLGVGLAGTVWKSGSRLIVDDYQNWSGRLAGQERAALQAVAGMPLKAGDQVIGVIGLAHLEAGRKFGESEEQVLTRFADFASIALENARLYARQAGLAEENRQAMERQASLAQENRQLLERAQQAVAELDAVNRRLTREGWQEFMASRQGRLVLQEGPAGPQANAEEPPVLLEAMERRQLVTGRENGSRLVALPIMVRGEVMGSLAIEDSAASDDWNSDELGALRSISEHLALALENARLFEQTQVALQATRRAAEREAQLAAINDRLHATTNVQAILQTAADELLRATGRSRAVVRLNSQHDEGELSPR